MRIISVKTVLGWMGLAVAFGLSCVALAAEAEARPAVRSCRGVGIVAGLAGTGSKKGLTLELLERYGESFPESGRRMWNRFPGTAALVAISADIPVLARPGDRFWAAVDALGDAASLEDGVMLTADLYDEAGTVVAQVEGPLIVDKDNPRSGIIVAGRDSGAVLFNRRRPATVMGGPNSVLVEKGDWVVCTATGIGWEIKARGLARGSGSAGEIVVVEDNVTKVKYAAVVTGPGNVEMLYSRARRQYTPNHAKTHKIQHLIERADKPERRTSAPPASKEWRLKEWRFN